MPTVTRIGPYRFYFFSHEPNEQPHIHVRRERKTAKFWLDPVALEYNSGFANWEVNKIESIIQRNRRRFLEVWDGYFGVAR